MERAPALSLLITLLMASFFLVPSNAIPVSRLQRMPLQDASEVPSVKVSTLKPEMETESLVLDDESMITARMAFETQDYAPSGPNNDHKPPGRR
uniref:Uncharacterized protein n=1 Tax=Arundo donax TaxID=35708 RepID=A0A0A8YXH9_ARUDO